MTAASETPPMAEVTVKPPAEKPKAPMRFGSTAKPPGRADQSPVI